MAGRAECRRLTLSTPTRHTFDAMSTTIATLWQPISTAPRDGTVIQVRSPAHGRHVMEWNSTARRWEGIVFAPMGSRRVCWDENAEQPTEWAALEP